MNKFLCFFAAIVAAVNGYSIGGGYGAAPGPVIGGYAAQLQPAVTLQLIPEPAQNYGSGGGYGAGGNYGGSAGGYGAGGYGAAAAPALSPAVLNAASSVDNVLSLAQLALSLPSAGGPIIDNSGSSGYGGYAPAPAPGNLAYVIQPAKSSYAAPAPAPGYGAPAPAPIYAVPAPAPAPVYAAPAPAPAPVYAAPAVAKLPSAAGAASYISGASGAVVPAPSAAY